MIDDVTPTEFVGLRETDTRWQVLDVREPWEIEVSALEHAIAIPMGEVARRLAELDSTRPTAVLCRSGVRSRDVAEFLSTQGFERLVNIAGGINAWSREVDDTLDQY